MGLFFSHAGLWHGDCSGQLGASPLQVDGDESGSSPRAVSKIQHLRLRGFYFDALLIKLQPSRQQSLAGAWGLFGSWVR